MKYFAESEFNGWYKQLSIHLLEGLDEFRHLWGYPVQISNHPKGIGRIDQTTSQHNINMWGEVRAIDVFPKNPLGYINDSMERQRAYNIAVKVGFTGIGIYTDTTPGNMLHLDVRTGPLKSWSRIGGRYKSIIELVKIV